MDEAADLAIRNEIPLTEELLERLSPAKRNLFSVSKISLFSLSCFSQLPTKMKCRNIKLFVKNWVI